MCLGAQLIASAMGAKVLSDPAKEIGWFPVYAASAENEFSLPSSMDVFHWHGETFDLTHGARLLARSEACENQAFQFGNRVLGFSFIWKIPPNRPVSLSSNVGESCCRQSSFSSGRGNSCGTGRKVSDDQQSDGSNTCPGCMVRTVPKMEFRLIPIDRSSVPGHTVLPHDDFTRNAWTPTVMALLVVARGWEGWRMM